MAAPMDINTARKSLTEELGESSAIYFQNLASWFKKKTSKEDFDLEARKLLSSDTVHLHNEFLLAIIAKCQSVSSSMVISKEAALQSASSSASRLHKSSKLKRKQSTSHRSHTQRFVPVNPMDYAPQVSCKPVEEGSTPLGFVSRDMLLPDSALIYGRALVCAWEVGLQDVQDSVIRLVIHALELQLKRILSAVMQKRSGYKLREKRFRFAMGCEVRNPYLRQACISPDPSLHSEATTVTNNGYHTPSLKPSVQTAEQTAAHELCLVDRPPGYRPPISMMDLLETLQLNKNIIPSHTVSAQAVEYAIHHLWHPPPEEEEGGGGGGRECGPAPEKAKPRPALSLLMCL
ncbi:transcriptional adapter 1-like [Babylonia areolata]|uniref:transcriptional adapter 1-like n=1 Tax=Babylonia areolata TaxID=304850 RepID=UPI003FCEEC9E